MTGEQKPGGLEVVGWIKRTNENHPIGLTQPSDWRFSPHEPLLSEGSKAEWFDQFRVTPVEPAEARIRELEARAQEDDLKFRRLIDAAGQAEMRATAAEAKLARAVDGLRTARGFHQMTHAHAAIDQTLTALQGDFDDR